MDVPLIALVSVMFLSGGFLGAFWVRALVNMRKQIVASRDTVAHLARVVAELETRLASLEARPGLPLPGGGESLSIEPAEADRHRAVDRPLDTRTSAGAATGKSGDHPLPRVAVQ